MARTDRAALDRRILAAHAAGDSVALAVLYETAAGTFEDAGDSDAAAFFLTQAYIHALEQGIPAAAALRARLVAMGRETPSGPGAPAE